MTTKSQASVIVTHRCGHQATRLVKAFNPHKKRYENVLDLAYLEGMRAPAVMLEGTRKRLETAVPKTIAYWQAEDCPKCWKASGYGAATTIAPVLVPQSA